LNAPGAHKPPWRVALPAFGGLRPGFQFIQSFSALASFKEFFFDSCGFMVWEIFCEYYIELAQQLTGL
jgi:hypothetical protein